MAFWSFAGAIGLARLKPTAAGKHDGAAAFSLPRWPVVWRISHKARATIAQNRYSVNRQYLHSTRTPDELLIALQLSALWASSLYSDASIGCGKGLCVRSHADWLIWCPKGF